MNRVATLGLFTLLSIPSISSVALADRQMGPMVPDAKGHIRTYVMVDPDTNPTIPTSEGTAEGGIPGISHVIYLNNCKPGGCALTPGGNGPAGQSNIISGAVNIAAYSGSDAVWQQVVQCVKDTYQPFGVTIVTTRPAGGNYHTAIVAGSPQQAGMDPGVLGVSPFSCGFLENAISFTFANETPGNVADQCWTVAQETAHSWGLDHKFDNKDPMTYLQSGPALKRFQNAAGSCGEYSARACQCGGNTMNSYAEVLATFGAAAPDTVPPTVVVSAPADGSTQEPGFAIRATVSDDVGLTEVEAKVDGMSVGKVYAFPFVWNAPATLAMGSHRVEVSAKDLMGNVTKKTVNVVYGSKCTAPTDCTTDGDTCVDGRCVPGVGQPGGLGSPCTMNDECASTMCAGDGTGSYCVEACDPAAQGCPSGFGCVETGPGAGVCFPGADGGGGGCETSGGATGPIVFGLAFGALALVRRRRN